MWSYLFLQRAISVTRSVPAPPDHVIQFLQDAPSMIMRSPVVFSFKELPSQPDTDSTLPHESKYLITDLVPLLFGLFHTKTIVLAAFTKSDNGTCMAVKAVAGTELKTTWTAVGNPTGGTVLTEYLEVTASLSLLARSENNAEQVRRASPCSCHLS